MVEILKTRFPTAKQIADGIEFLSPLKDLPGWTVFVQYDLTPNPKNDDEWIEDFRWGVKQPETKTKKRRRVYLGTQQTGLGKLSRLPEKAQAPFQKYVHTCWEKKIDATAREMERRWAAEEEAEAQAIEEGEICGS